MTVGVGDKLDKYELKERVGQGGMAVVYRGIDTSLRREVAVKVLHHHLAESEEARIRFEREAHAVAKLRHENILEIFDFSGAESEESYIVTEFIEGQTLREFMAQRDITFPEIGAMIAVQVCRALRHAHGLGVLHRDVKPENIMVRSDGVVKLTDFGIAQMVDVNRMTVTGQLLGSPAYMSPEHVEGGALDVRTDVFAVGIVLYQLVTGKLPFDGRNAHEILKRIADCKYRDPRQVNPRVGRELARLIDTALARDKDERFSDVAAMLQALDDHLQECELTDCSAELARYFESAPSYEMALRPRLISALTARGRESIKNEPSRALEFFNRVLTIEPQNEEVLAEIDRIGRRRRGLHLALAAASFAVAVGVGVAVYDWLGTTSAAPLAVVDASAPVADAARLSAAVDARPPPPAVADKSDNPPPSAARPVASTPPSAGTATARRSENRSTNGGRSPKPPVSKKRILSVTVVPRNSEIKVGAGDWQATSKGRIELPISTAETVVRARNSECCAPTQKTIAPGDEATATHLALSWLPASVTPQCDVPGVSVKVGGRQAALGRASPVFIKNAMGRQRVIVKFFDGKSYFDEQSITLRFKEAITVRCKK